MKYKVKILIQTNMGTNTDTKLIEISPYMHQIGHSLNSREITRNVQEGNEKVVKIGKLKWLTGLQMIQFECPRHWKPLVSSNFGVV